MTAPAAPEFLFDFGSPNCFLVHRALPALEARTGVRFRYAPILLGGVFKATGNRSPMEKEAGCEAKLAYLALENRRFIDRHGIADFRRNPHFPVNTLGLMRGAVAARRMGVYELYVEEMFRAMWTEGLNMADPEVLAGRLAVAGLDAPALIAAAQDPEVKAELVAETEAAVARGTFGAPTIFVGEEIFFGKDSLGLVEEAIVAATAA
ncbi:2-hydroxychromene-2-carboxylate isomerase [Albimonas pacifica]|nr:2-hydroxychromene-2-carboxylate isomerase [Albimonas pacifica]